VPEFVDIELGLLWLFEDVTGARYFETLLFAVRLVVIVHIV